MHICKNRITHPDFAPEVRNALNELIRTCGGREAHEKAYAVFDFDNTCSVFDTQEQVNFCQLERMAYAFTPEQYEGILLNGIEDPDRELEEYGYGHGSFRDYALDLCNAYRKLWEKYGPFDALGLPEEIAAKVRQDPWWLEFSVKMHVMYELVTLAKGAVFSYPWALGAFVGMSPDELYRLSLRSLEKYKKEETRFVRHRSPEGLPTRTGPAECVWNCGISVPEPIVELWSTLQENGIDVWVCSASAADVIRAAVDCFQLHGHLRGILGMTAKIKDGKFSVEYDAENGCGYEAKEDGWQRMTRPTKAAPQCEGKVTAIRNAIAPEYGGRGPSAGFMDSSGDFNFCTEFSSMKLALCLNTGTHPVTDGGGLIAVAAMLEKERYGADLRKAEAEGETLYLLQGRDTRGMRRLVPENSSIRLHSDGRVEELLFADEQCSALLESARERKLSVSALLNGYAKKKKAGENGLSFDTGFLDEFHGYHSIKP